MTFQVLLLLAQAATLMTDQCPGDLRPPQRLGIGPHALVIVGPKGNTRINYKTGDACSAAKTAVLEQAERKYSGITFPMVKALCVPL